MSKYPTKALINTLLTSINHKMKWSQNYSPISFFSQGKSTTFSNFSRDLLIMTSNREFQKMLRNSHMTCVLFTKKHVLESLSGDKDNTSIHSLEINFHDKISGKKSFVRSMHDLTHCINSLITSNLDCINYILENQSLFPLSQKEISRMINDKKNLELELEKNKDPLEEPMLGVLTGFSSPLAVNTNYFIGSDVLDNGCLKDMFRVLKNIIASNIITWKSKLKDEPDNKIAKEYLKFFDKMNLACEEIENIVLKSEMEAQKESLITDHLDSLSDIVDISTQDDVESKIIAKSTKKHSVKKTPTIESTKLEPKIKSEEEKDQTEDLLSDDTQDIHSCEDIISQPLAKSIKKSGIISNPTGSTIVDIYSQRTLE